MKNIRSIGLLCIAGFLAVPMSAKTQAKTNPPASQASTPTRPQNSTSHSSTPQIAKDQQPYEKEAFVIEKYVTRLRFENDGTGERELRVRVRAQSAAGVQQLKTLVFSYDAKNEIVNVEHTRVTEKSGEIRNLGPESVEDLPARFVKDAPAYSAYREKHIVIKGLQEGSVIDYQVNTKINSAFIPGEFCYEHDFVDAAVVLEEQLEANLPAGREVTIRSAKIADSKKEAAGRTIYTWKHSNLVAHNKDSNADPADEHASDATRAMNLVVEITTFKTWEQVGRWYSQLAAPEIEKSAEVSAKAEEVTEGCKTDHDRIAALYTFVAQRIRYVSLPFGAGHYQPLKPAGVLKNGYGDSQDKQVLLGALLESIGVRADAAFINSARNLNEQAPSPAQFDHVITVIPKDAATKQIWLDATAEVAPFEYLLPNLRDKNALVLSRDGAVRIERTPENPPFPSSEVVDVDARLSELGKLTAKVEYKLRGDNEFAFRSAFHRAPEAGWNQIGQTVALLDGLQGQVTNVHAGDPLDTTKPFEFSFDFAQRRAADWSQKRSTLSIPLPSLGMPPAPKNDARVDFGTPLDVTLDLKLEFPDADSLTAPVGVTVLRDYAEYRSTYKVEGHSLQVRRTVRFKMNQLAADRAEDYRAFTRAALADQNQPITLGTTPKDANAVASSAKADELVEAGDTALDSGNVQVAVDLLRRAEKLEPSRKDIWNNLGLAYLRLGQVDPAINAFQMQTRLSSRDSVAHDYLGAAYLQQHKEMEAVAAFRKQLEINPLDKFAHASLGVLYFDEQKYSDALPELEKAAILNPDNAQIEITLGKCYLKTGKQAEARTAFDKAVQISPTGEIFNAVAYEMVHNNFDLEKAQQYATNAVKERTESLRDVDLDHLTLKDLSDVQDIGAFWGTLGLIHLRQGDVDSAGMYLECAWVLTQSAAAGKHLAEVYEKRGQKERAVQLYHLAAMAKDSDPDIKTRLETLKSPGEKSDQTDSTSARPASDLLVAARTFSVAPIQSATGRADLFILLSAGPKNASTGTKAERVKFVSGDSSLKTAGDQLRAIDFGEMIPPGTATKVIRRGTLDCTTGGCTLVLALPQDVRSLD